MVRDAVILISKTTAYIYSHKRDEAVDCLSTMMGVNLVVTDQSWHRDITFAWVLPQEVPYQILRRVTV